MIEKVPRRACPSLLAALDWSRQGTVVRTHPGTLEILSRQYWPTTVLTVSQDLPKDAAGIVCRGMTCLTPATSLDIIIQQQLLQTATASE